VQYADAAIGEVITAMEKAGIYEDALLIVLADHGISFEAGLEHWRRILPETVGDVAAVPMFIKAPGREGGLIDDRRALTIDLLPTIAEVLGFVPDWELEGQSLFGPAPDRTETTTTGPVSEATYGVDGNEKLVMAARNAEWFPTGDPWELLPDGAADLRGERVSAVAEGESDLTYRIHQPDWYAHVDRDSGVIPVRITGVLGDDGDTEHLLGVAVNGVIGAMTRSYENEGETLFQVMVEPSYFREGDNSIALVEIDGDMVRSIPES
jgi:hypothetical protein